ncbi:DEAD/DEAH box helicase [Ornithinimicrobium murale]|uniref:DEAD/DEAH box helicase n=1 Tax=Ornithinimicrobium murale TaxID=1050153 RepID=UPI000E0DDF44|nr:DEAD/DEAH box helicase family protein [Ornithinimicrobium murale]
MRYDLKEYQSEAARDLIGAIREGVDSHRQRDRLSSVTLSAITGAGKTVIATSVIEALLYGSETLDVTADRRLVFLWVTDDPVLNRQTAFRMKESASTLVADDLVEIEAGFHAEKLEPSKVYFVNIQRLSRTSTLVKPGEGRTWSLWQTLANTVNDSDVDLVVVQDEAHRGSAPAKDAPTIVSRIISGTHDGAPQPSPVPMVWGISATPGKFDKAMLAARRTILPSHNVEVEAVRDSGLLKKKIRVARPDEAGIYDTTTLRESTAVLAGMTKDWAEHCATDVNITRTVVPVMVVQVPDKPKTSDLASYIEVIEEAWRDAHGQDLEPDAVVNVFGEHETLELGDCTVRYISPELIQDDDTIRVVLAKTAITTGWDCPRAEILFSMRGAKDETHIAQLLGRIVRTPLADHVVGGNDTLNAVWCFLPKFHGATLNKVVAHISGKAGDPEDDTGVVVELASVDLVRNPKVEPEVFELFESLPSWVKPSAPRKPMDRLRSLAALVAADEVVEDPTTASNAELCRLLDGVAGSHRDKVTARVEDIREASLSVTDFDNAGEQGSIQELALDTDRKNLADAWTAAKKELPQGLAQIYLDWTLEQTDGGKEAASEEDIETAELHVAALATLRGLDASLPHAKAMVEAKAEEIVSGWLAKARPFYEGRRNSRAAEYEAVLHSGTEPTQDTLAIPETGSTDGQKMDGDKAVDLPTEELHLLSDVKRPGLYPLKLNAWESKVLEVELNTGQPVVGWYRNPSRSNTALRIAYRDGESWGSMQPDLVFATRDRNDGQLQAHIVDPHGGHLADALPKLQGLAEYAERFGDRYSRIDAVGWNSDKQLRALSLQNEKTRAAVMAFTEPDVTALYDSHGHLYPA